MAEKKESTQKELALSFNLEEMAEAGLHFGHRASAIQPKMKPYIYGVRNGVHVIDLEKTAASLKAALDFIYNSLSEKKVLLLVGTKIQIKNLVKETAEECSLPYVSERWLGGTFTNFETIKKRVEYYKELERKKAAGELEKYTKKERAKFDKELSDLKTKFEGIRNLEKLPEAVFIFDMKKDDLAVREARLRGIKIIGLADTNIDPTHADFPIPANDDAVSSVKYILLKLKEVVLSAKLKAQISNPEVKA